MKNIPYETFHSCILYCTVYVHKLGAYMIHMLISYNSDFVVCTWHANFYYTYILHFQQNIFIKFLKPYNKHVLGGKCYLSYSKRFQFACPKYNQIYIDNVYRSVHMIIGQLLYAIFTKYALTHSTFLYLQFHLNLPFF